MVMIKGILPALLFMALCLIISKSTFAQQAQKDTTVYTVVEIKPQYPGGDDALMKYLAINISYPQVAKDKGIQGTVYVSFIVEKDGSITNIKILRSLGGGCDEEVIRVVKAMPVWEPGKQAGKPVRVQFLLPVKFKQ
jgi:periplasmic protein TonB